MIQNGSATYTYDGENRLTATAGWTYVYDGDGMRVKKSNGTSGTLYWNGPGFEPISESDLAGTNLEEYVFFGGKRVARRDVAGNQVHYYFSDHLGSASVVTNASGAIEDESDYYPYGGEMVITNLVPQNYKFTGKERDAESGLDMFGARYYGSSLGRFMTPDWAAKPIAVPYAYFGDPQSLNLYSYVGNNPLKRADPDGHCPSDNPNCGKVKVTVDQPTPEMKINVAGPNGATSGPGVQTTIKITDNGKNVTNTDVTEHPVVKDNITGASHPANGTTANTKDTGQIKDNVIAPMEHNSANTPEHKAELTSDSLSMPAYSNTTSQTLTFTTPSGAACQATYTEVLQNMDPSTGKFNPVNSNGVNFTFTATDPVVSPQPQNQ